MTNHGAYFAQLEEKEREANKKLKTQILLFLLLMVLIVPSALANGYVLSTLWGWFMVPIFNLPALGIAAAMGIWTVISFMTHQVIYTKDERTGTEQAINAIVLAVTKPSLALLVGYIIKSFM